MPELEAEWFDNRGQAGVMFGFVYFNDGRRVAYATGHGVTDGSGGWEEITPEHQRVAKEFLDREAPGWNQMPAKP